MGDKIKTGREMRTVHYHPYLTKKGVRAAKTRPDVTGPLGSNYGGVGKIIT